jgi:hypothetical protein
MRSHEFIQENLASFIAKGASKIIPKFLPKVPAVAPKIEPTLGSVAKTVTQAVGKVEQFPVANILNSKGGIGSQGVSASQMSDLFNNVLGVKVPPTATMDQLITTLKSNPAAQARLRDFTAKNPIQIRSYPDNYYEVADGNHRAYLLYKLGDKTIPAVVK